MKVKDLIKLMDAWTKIIVTDDVNKIFNGMVCEIETLEISSDGESLQLSEETESILNRTVVEIIPHDENTVLMRVL